MANKHRLSPAAVQRAAQLYVQGYTLRQLEEIFPLKKDALAAVLKTELKEDYKNISSLRKKTDTLTIIEEDYLKKPGLSAKQKQEIKLWLTTEKIKEIAAKDANSEVRLLTLDGEESFRQQKSQEQISRGLKSGDYRDLIDSVDIQKTDFLPYLPSINN